MPHAREPAPYLYATMPTQSLGHENRRIQTFAASIYPKTVITYIYMLLTFLSFNRDGRKYDRTRFNNNVVSNDFFPPKTL